MGVPSGIICLIVPLQLLAKLKKNMFIHIIKAKNKIIPNWEVEANKKGKTEEKFNIKTKKKPEIIERKKILLKLLGFKEKKKLL